MPVVNRERWLCATMLELADVDPATFSEAEYSHELAGRLAELLDPAEVMVLLVGEGGHLCLAAASTERARWLAGVEVLAAEGPCTLGYRTSRAALNRGNAALAVQWPRFAVAVRAARIRHVSVFPMRRRGESIGAVGALGVDDRLLSTADAGLAHSLINAAAVGISQQRAYRYARLRSEQLQNALDSRLVIEQAKGALAVRLGVPVDAAFESLRGYARSRNRKLVAVARDVVCGELPPGLIP